MPMAVLMAGQQDVMLAVRLHALSGERPHGVAHVDLGLACISHHPAVEARDTSTRTSLRLLAVLNVRFKYACARQAARASP